MTTSAVTTVALDVATILGVTVACTAVTKALTEVWVRPTARLHDPLVQLEALLIGIGWSFVFMWAFGPLSRGAAVQTVVSVILGLVGGSGGVGIYHISTALKTAAAGNLGPQGTRTVVAPADATVSVVAGPRTTTSTLPSPPPPPGGGEATPPGGGTDPPPPPAYRLP